MEKGDEERINGLIILKALLSQIQIAIPLRPRTLF